MKNQILNRWISVFLVGSLLAVPMAAQSGSITSQNKDENQFIRITETPRKKIRIEICSIEKPSSCKRIGKRDYTVVELETLKYSRYTNSAAVALIDIALAAVAAKVIAAGLVVGTAFVLGDLGVLMTMGIPQFVGFVVGSAGTGILVATVDFLNPSTYWDQGSSLADILGAQGDVPSIQVESVSELARSLRKVFEQF